MQLIHHFFSIWQKSQKETIWSISKVITLGALAKTKSILLSYSWNYWLGQIELRFAFSISVILRSIGGLDYYLSSFELLNYSFVNAYRKRLTSHTRKVSFGENLDRLQLGLWNKEKNLLVFVSNYNWLGPTGAVISAQHKPPLLTVGAVLNKVRRNAKSLPLSYCYCRYYYTHASTQENLVERGKACSAEQSWLKSFSCG